MKKWAGLRKSGRSLEKVGVAYKKIPREKWAGLKEKWAGLMKSGRGLCKNNLRLRR